MDEQKIESFFYRLKILINEREYLFFTYELKNDYLYNVKKRRIENNEKIEELLNDIFNEFYNCADEIEINRLFNLLLTINIPEFPLVNKLLTKANYNEKFSIYYKNIEYRLLKNMKMSAADKNALATMIVIDDHNYNYNPIYNKIFELILLNKDQVLEYDDFKKMLVLYIQKKMKVYSCYGKCFIKDLKSEKRRGSTINNIVFLYDDYIHDFYYRKVDGLLFTIFHELVHVYQYERKKNQILSLLNIMELKDFILSLSLDSYYETNYQNISYECEAEYIGILNTLSYFEELKLDFNLQDKYLKKVQKCKERIAKTERIFKGQMFSLDEIFNTFIYNNPLIIEQYPLLKYEYKVVNKNVIPKTEEEMQDDLKKLLLDSNLSLEEKRRITDFYSCFINNKSRIS